MGPIGGDLLGADHLAARARAVARGQRLVTSRLPLRPARLLARLAETRRILRDAHTRLLSAAAEGVDAGPAAEWLLDNYHVVQEQLQEVRASLPGRYYRELPELADGPMTGYPRVYEMAISLISHSEARIDLDNVDLYVASFQSVSPLTIGELWAMPAMLRIGLIESVRRMTLRTIERLDQRALAEHWADEILEASDRGGTELRNTLRAFADAAPTLNPHFVARLLQLLRQSEGASPPLRWLEHWMRESGTTPESSVAMSTQRVALTRIMMANSITSLRSIGRRDWRVFVERQSVMEAVLREDPSGHYAQMTFATRDLYRHVVERIAKGTGHRETSVAQWAIDLARRHTGAVPDATDTARAHVGFYLLDKGLGQLERTAGYAPSTSERLIRLARSRPNLFFLGGVATCTLLAVLSVMLLADGVPRGALWLVLLFAFLPALDIAISVFNQVATTLLPPRPLARLDLHEHGIPVEYRTAVVVPTLFGDTDAVHAALENLEVQFLANREANLHFAVLSDFTDAPTEVQPDDASIIAAAVEGIHALNDRHSDGTSRPFSLLHRPRRWNPAQGVWMGWERKRGKLAEFNLVLRGQGADDAFSTIVGDVTELGDVRYVITLDADTVLPSGAATALIGAMAHPLNRAVYDVSRQRMVRGYGVLQPQVGVSLPSAHRTRFAAIASGHPGVDPYTVAASDVYQDLYGEGSFTGKGIYDVDAFQEATHGRFPENVLLSHDLLEGNYARAGLATDVIVYDDYPATYEAFTRRKHRWIRGDWQLLPWLRRRVPGPDGPEPNRLSLVSQWKILDNLRRSVVELSQLIFLIAGWTLLPGSSVRWTLLGIGAVLAPWIIALLRAALWPPFDQSWRAYYGAVARDAAVSVQQATVAIAILPHQALISIDAIARTLYRLAISRRHLLDWQTASAVDKRALHGPDRSDRSLRFATVVMALGALALSATAVERVWLEGLPWVTLIWPAVALWGLSFWWLYAPRLMRVLRRPAVSAREPLSTAARLTASGYAERHWHFYTSFVTAETHWLAPDNFQSDPEPVVAMRTSPTNIGLQLLAIVSAHDLALIDVDDMIDRLEATTATMATMARYRGHFYNWYDLHDLRVLEPPYISTVDSGNLAGHLIALRQACLEIGARHADHPARQHRLAAIAELAYGWMTSMEFGFLYDERQKLFTIGYHPDSFSSDSSYYDLLASEARLASFVAIAKNEVPVEHWFRLSRALNRSSGSMALVSWSGSMFEYLMPVLVMRSLPFTMLDQTYHGAIDRQRRYARARRVPYGVSESAYNVRDHQQTYQYRAFGVPDLALKRGLGNDLVIAPYASALTAMIDPPHAIANLQQLESLGALGPYGFCDSLDYTRPAIGARFALVRAYMAHHIGMTLVSLTNVLLDDVWQHRFHADALVKSAELLLHERVPRRLSMQGAQQVEVDEAVPSPGPSTPVVREVDLHVPGAPRVALLGSSPYAVMLREDGTGYSTYEGRAVTRWHADSAQEVSGQFCYLKDLTNGRTWSAAHQPIGAPSDTNRAWLSADRVTFQRVDGDIETRTTIMVVPGDAAEVRNVTLTNAGRVPHDIELTSYSEVVMGSADADRAHPAFANLFVETEWHAWCTAITATRRRRSPDDPALWCVHVVDAGADRVAPVTCETDRARFVGRGRSVRDPIALEMNGALSGSTGPVLDPILALRTRVRVRPGQSVSVSFTTLVADSRASAFALADRYHDSHAAERALDFTWSATQLELNELGISPTSAATFQDIAAQLLFRSTSLAPPLDEIRRNVGAQPRLWTYGISGDRPIVLAAIDQLEGLPTLRELCLAHRFWRRRGLVVDLVILNGHAHDYLQELRDGINDVLVACNEAASIDQPGGVFVRRRDAFTPDDLLMLSATARIHISCDGRLLTRILESADALAMELPRHRAMAESARRSDRVTPASVSAVDEPVEREGTLASLVSAFRPMVAPLRPLLGLTPRMPNGSSAVSSVPKVLRFDNGIGGLDTDNAYEMTIQADHLPPAPWSNVIANPHGGFLVSETGAGCTWAENAYFFRLTPWHNDPVTNPISDVLYLRDLDSDAVWSATPAPIRSADPYRVRHAPGESSFYHEHDGIVSELTVGVPIDAAAKLSRLRLRNMSPYRRRIAVTAYVEWTLGVRREETQYQVHTRFVPELSAICAVNHFDPSFSNWVAYLAASEPIASYTADRRAFVGDAGSVANPVGVRLDELDGASGVGLDPCGALQMMITLAPGETRELAVLLGAAASDEDARRDIARLRGVDGARAAVASNVDAWSTRLGVVSVSTPVPAFDAMLNTWLPYQALGCRLWARMGLYQSSGAYGFRDQLQDVLAFLYADPAIAREHILRAAARQFLEGDVQHWWHAHTGRGVRTRFSDDLAWLPYVVDRYVVVTGDASVLEEYVPYVTMRALNADEHELYDLPRVTDEHGSIYEHCRRALRRACTTGDHGLPLIGSGDWNDGMSRVGIAGKGESVWLAWFLVSTLRAFAPYAERRGDIAEASWMRQQADAYVAAAEASGWDGAWYRRAYFDDGTPMGSASGDECRIDSIAQSWSVISGAAMPARQAMAMQAVNAQLVQEDTRLIMLLTPPFDRGTHDPGYIKGYVPGVRENGAQYTHAALWTVMATAMQGDGERAFALFQMLNPLTHSDSASAIERYKVEPYVIAADVYTAPSLSGRGGWTWYTGSASWMYRVGLEQLLGFTKVGDTLRVLPNVPSAWPSFTIRYVFGASTYVITVTAPSRIRQTGAVVTVDGIVADDQTIHLTNDGGLHTVSVQASGTTTD